MKPEQEPDWEPAQQDRVYYRSSEDGQRAYIVRRDGKDMLRLDRPMEEILRKFDPEGHEWKLDSQVYPLSEVQMAQVAFVADRALCGALGKHKDGREDWLSLSDRARIKFMREGPDTGDVRDTLYDAIIGTLRGYVGKH